MVAPHHPTIKARAVGIRLKGLRELAGLSITDAANRSGIGEQKIRRIEKAQVRPEREDIELLLGASNAPYTEGREILALFEGSWESGWWLKYPDIVVGPYVEFEQQAQRIETWQPGVVPGLLQTDLYARAVITAGIPHIRAEEVERRVRVRAERRTILARKDAPTFHAIIGESILHQQIGGPDVARGQLRHLMTVAEQDNVTVQVVPFTAGAHAGLGGQSVILGFAEAMYPDVVFVEGPGGGWYGESDQDLDTFRLVWGDVADAALSPEDSAALIAALT